METGKKSRQCFYLKWGCCEDRLRTSCAPAEEGRGKKEEERDT